MLDQFQILMFDGRYEYDVFLCYDIISPQQEDDIPIFL